MTSVFSILKNSERIMDDFHLSCQRQRIPLLNEVPLLQHTQSTHPIADIMNADDSVLINTCLASIGRFSLYWHKEPFKQPSITVEFDNDVVYFWYRPEQDARELSISGERYVDMDTSFPEATRFLWLDLPLTPLPQLTQETSSIGGNGELIQLLVRNKNLSPMILKWLALRDLQSLSHSCVLLREHARQWIEDYQTQCVYSRSTMIDPNASLSSLIRAHGAVDHLRVSAIYYSAVEVENMPGLCVDHDYAGKIPHRFVRTIIIEMRFNGVECVRWVDLPLEVQKTVKRRTFVD
jgi:hypothetical protein